MEDQALRVLLEKLQAEIKNSKMVNPNDQELLSRLDLEISEFLRRADESGGKYHPTAVKRLQDGLSQLESSHLRLTSLITEILDVLSNAGV